MSRWNATTIVRVIFWTVAILVGAAEIWVVRHYVNPDGISYIEVATKYLQHDWSYAINSYWSPLYSWAIALAFFLLRPTPYWEVATAHLVVFIAYLATLAAFDLFLSEVTAAVKPDSKAGFSGLPVPVIYVGAYAAFLYAALSMIMVGFCSPDMIAFALVLLVVSLPLRIRRKGGSNSVFVLFGIACALLYLDRTALVPFTAVCLLVIVISLRQQNRPLIRPVLTIIVAALIIAGPFVLALVHHTHRLTLGDSGLLNYGWEVDGARHYIHWQGEPYDIGKPIHPTTPISSNPEAFAFAKPIPASYPPWFDPSYWYQGIRPKLKLRSQISVAVVNFSIVCYYIVRSPIFLPSCLLIALSGLSGWPRRLLSYWPILLPALLGILIYCAVFVEKRYIAADLLLIWIVFLASVPLRNEWLRIWGPRMIVGFSLLFTLLFVVRRQRPMVVECLRDLKHTQERWWNVDYLLAQRLAELGLRPGDKVAYVGRTMDVEWARLGHFQLVAEVPIVYSRYQRLFDNSLIESTGEIEKFWNGDDATRARVLRAFRDSGARMVVADGYYCAAKASQWQRILKSDEPHVPGGTSAAFTQVNSRYLWLGPDLPDPHPSKE